jgi:hypothetical protein
MPTNNEKPAGTSGGSSGFDHVYRQDQLKRTADARFSQEPGDSVTLQPAVALIAAHALASRGLAVFPVSEDCRRSFTKHGYQDANKIAEVA